MVHFFAKPTAVVDTAIKLLQREIILPQLVWLNGVGDFSGKYNDTINVRVPAAISASRMLWRAGQSGHPNSGASRTIQTSDLTEDTFPVTLTHRSYTAVNLTDEQLIMDIHDFASQVLSRQVRAVAEDLENGLASTIVGADYATNNMFINADSNALWSAIVDGRRKLNDRFVDRTQRRLVVGSAVEAALLKDPTFQRYDSTGETPSALRDAVIGRIANMDVVVSDALPHGNAYMFHPTAFIMVSRPPAAPQGASFTSAASAAGLAVRWLMDYDYSQTTDRSLVDTFVGYKAVADPNSVGFVRGVKIHMKATSVTVSGPATVAGSVGAQIQLKATDSNGDDVTSTATWATSDATKATVSSAGVVTKVANGSTNITAAIDGVTSANFAVAVTS